MLTTGKHLKNAAEEDAFFKFLHKYGGLAFPKVRFRPGVAFTADFGLDNAFNKLRFHDSIDRGNERTEIFAPFDLTYVELTIAGMDIWGIQLKLHTAYGFEVRVAHIEDIPDDLMLIIKSKAPVPSGTYLCEAGNAGMSTGIHTHTSIVSYGEKSAFLEETLNLKYGGFETVFYTEDDVEVYLNEKNIIEPDVEEAFKREYAKKRITEMNNYLCRRTDYWTNKASTYYSSKKLFGF